MSSAEAFNQIPAHCAGICELSQQFVDENGIVLALNCEGPQPNETKLTDQIKVEGGEVTRVYDDRLSLISSTLSKASGKLACANVGARLWATDRTEAFKEGK